MLVSNGVTNDVRVMREARTLVKDGFSVCVFGIGLCKEEMSISNIDIFLSSESNFSCFIKKIRKTKTPVNNQASSQKKTLFQSVKSYIYEKIKGYLIYKLIMLDSQTLYQNSFGSVKAKCYHAHDLDMLLPCYKLAKKNKAKLVYDSHELWTEMTGINSYVSSKFKRIERELIDKCDLLITVSDFQLKKLKEWYHFGCDDLLIMNSTEFSMNSHVSKVTDHKLHLVYIGFYLPGRGIDEEIEAMSEVNENVYFTLYINKSEYSEQLKQKIAVSNLKNRVLINYFVAQDKVIDEISAYDIGIVPYRAISLNAMASRPNKLFQYMAAGLAILGNDLPELNFIINETNAGMIYDAEIPRDFIQKVNFLSNNIEKVNEMKFNSLLAIKERYNWNIIGRVLCDRYKLLLTDKQL